jgi:hypothetical protein
MTLWRRMETEPMAVAITAVANRYRVPALGSLYEALGPLSLPLVRVTAGLLLVPHGAQKLFGAWGPGPNGPDPVQAAASSR